MDDTINKITKQQNIKVEHLPAIQHCSKIEIIPNQKEFLSKLLNEYLHEAYNSEEFTNSRYEFAKSGGKLFKEELHEKWDGSDYQMYLNTLLRNLNEYTPFALNTTDNLILKSFSAFCQKGDSDIDKLEDYLVSNEIGDFRIAFALWGIVFGFANMPKTLTNDLFRTNDLDYTSDTYKYIFKQVHNIDLEGQIEKKQRKETIVVSSKINDNADKYEPIKDSGNNNDAFSELKNKLHPCKLKSEQLDSIFELYQKNHNNVDDKLFTDIGKIRGIGKKTIEKIKIALEFVDKPKVSTPIEGQLSLEYEKSELGTEFYKDSNILEHLESCLPNDKKIKKQFKEDLNWFQGNYQEYYNDKKKGMQKGFYFGKPTNNDSVIEKFQDYLKNKKNGNQDWLRKIYFSINIEQIISKLKELYL